MITAVNEAINRKLASMSFTTIVNGIVESLNPLQIRINSRIVIGSDFIEPKSLGIDDYSPGQTLPLIVGEKLQMVRYNNGQRFYVLGKSVSSSEVDYSALQNKPKLNTNNATAQSVNSSEEINGTIKLHKISKTGNYNDSLNRPIIDYQVQDKLKDVRGIYLNEFNGRITSGNFVKTASDYGTMRFDLATSSMTTEEGKPASDGYLQTYFWDNNSTYDTQLFIPNNINGSQRLGIRSRNGVTDWSNWKYIPTLDDVLLYDVISTW